MNKWHRAWVFLSSFIASRYLLRFCSRDRLEAWQRKQLTHFLQHIAPNAPFYKQYKGADISELPTMSKASLMAEFSERNTQGIDLDEAMEVATRAEQSRRFTPTIRGITVGMSSGTSGKRGLFLVSEREQARWAGTLLAQTLPPALLGQILKWWQPKLSIAFFLRANSNLYSSLNGRRINFCFYDLLQGVDQQTETLNAQQSRVLVAPATVLARLAQLALQGSLKIKPLHIISVAEVLETSDARLVEQAFSRKPHQIYQATEGFLGYTCELGKLHLNEANLYIEKEWLDKAAGRFYPVVTDFSRETQLIVRYRLNDILRASKTPCSCGRADTCLDEIEGRSDQVLWLPHSDSRQPTGLYPDTIRQSMMLLQPALQEYSIEQRGMEWFISVLCEGCPEKTRESIEMAIGSLCKRAQVDLPVIEFSAWVAPPLGEKRRRLWCYEPC